MSLRPVPLRAHRSMAGWSALALVGSTVFGAVIVTRPRSAALLIGAALVGFLVLRREVRILVPLTTLALVVDSSTLPFGSSAATFAGKFALLGAVGATAFGALLDRDREHRLPGPFAVAFLALVGMALLSATYSLVPSLSVEHALSLLLLWLAVAVAVPLAWRRAEEMVRLVGRVGLVAAGTVAAGFVLTAAGAVWGYNAGRYQGLLENPNTLGYFIAPILPALVIAAAHDEDRARRRRLLAAVAVLAVGLVLSGSRGGLLASSFGTGVGLAAAHRARRVLAVVLVAGIVAAVPLAALNRPLRSAGDELLSIGTGGGRIVVWPDGLRLIREHPLHGIGFGVTPTVYPQLRDQRLSNPSGSRLERLHNSYLETALELGWPGAAFMVVLALSGAVVAWRQARAGGPWGLLGAILLAGIAGGLMEATFESGLLAAGGLLAFHFWLLVAAAHATRLRARMQALADRPG